MRNWRQDERERDSLASARGVNLAPSTDRKESLEIGAVTLSPTSGGCALTPANGTAVGLLSTRKRFWMVPSSICRRIWRPSARGVLMNSGEKSLSCATKVTDRSSGDVEVDRGRAVSVDQAGGQHRLREDRNHGSIDDAVANSAECTTMSSPGLKAAIRDAGIATA